MARRPAMDVLPPKESGYHSSIELLLQKPWRYREVTIVMLNWADLHSDIEAHTLRYGYWKRKFSDAPFD